MEREFWLERWRTGSTGWHQRDVHPFLLRHGHRLLGLPAEGADDRNRGSAPSEPAAATDGSHAAATRSARVFVPLCGASLDMLWLRERGATVVGIDLSDLAFQRFFDDAGLEPRVDRTCLFERWSADGIELLAGDFFDADATVLGPFDAVYDRAALFALPRELRTRYARHLSGLCRTGTRVLLTTLEYAQAEMPGPPFAVQPDELNRLYSATFTLELLERVDVLASNARLQERGVTALSEAAWYLSRA